MDNYTFERGTIREIPKDNAKRFLIKKSVYAVSYIVLAIAIEIITFITMGIGVVPTHFGLDIAAMLFFASIVFVIPNSIAELVLVLVFLCIQYILSIVNVCLYAMNGTVFSFDMLNLAYEVTGVMDASFIDWWFVALVGVLYIAAGSGLIVFTVQYRVENIPFARNLIVIMLVMFLIVESCAGLLYSGIVSSFSVDAEEIKDEYGLEIFYDEELLYEDQAFNAKAFREFGTFGYFFVNIGNTISDETYVDEVSYDALDRYFASGEMSNDVYGENIYTGAIDEKNVVLIVIESGEWYGINKEYTPTLYAMAEQGIRATNFHSRDKTNVSEAIGIMGSYPSITELEPAQVLGNSMPYALSNIFVSEGYTTNYFHANDGKFYKRNEVFSSLFGFEYLYFIEDMEMLDGHTEKDDFYDMDKDSNVFKYYIDEFTYSNNGEPFYTQMMTLTTHGRYTDLENYGNYPYETTPEHKGEVSSGEMSEEKKIKFSENCDVNGLEDYYEIIDRFPSTYVSGTNGIDEDYLDENEIYSEMFLLYKRYQAAMMDLDYGVNMLVQDLELSGELDDTVFVFYADHSAYYHQLNFALKGIDSEESYNTDVYKTPFFIWYGGSMDLTVEALSIDGYKSFDFVATVDMESSLRTMEIDKYTTTQDVLPTMLHLMGYSYNLNLYQGVSIFSDEERVFASHESGIFIEDIYFDTIYIYRREGEEWVQYEFETTYIEGGFDGEEYEDIIEFLIDAKNFYIKEAMLDAVVLLDYFAEREIDGYIMENGSTIEYIVKL